MHRLILILAALLFLPVSAAEDDRPVVKDSELPADQAASKSLPVLWLAGDSTVRNGGIQRGWGEEIGKLLDPAKIQLMNRAIGGRSSRTFLKEGRWEKMLGEMKKGDIVLVQFGHNDMGPVDAEGKFRGSLRSIGNETEEVKMPDGSTETVHSYGWYLRYIARTGKAKGVTVVLCSPVPHKKFDSAGKFVQDWPTLRGWVKSCAASEGVEFIDLAGLIGDKYAALPPAEVEAFFGDKGTHTNTAGAQFNAKCVVEGAGKLLAPYLKGAR